MSIVFAAAALADLDQIEDDLRAVGPHVLLLFHERLARALSLRESFPLSAPEYQPPDPRLPGMRYFPIRRFNAYAVFYQPTESGIRVVRVLHTSRNLAVLFTPDPP
ncbi:MAG: type II toxin-antitoxin system RelE/ParE family toxin [Gemmataceae bacterium]